MATKVDVIKTYLQTLDKDPALLHAIKLEHTIAEVEQTLDIHLTRLLQGKSSFDDWLHDLHAKHHFNEKDVVEEIESARETWKELELEAKVDISKHRPGGSQGSTVVPMFWNPFSRCNRCKIGISAAVIALGGLLGIVAAYSAGAAVPAYFAAIAAALGISVTALFAILGAIVAGTVSISSFPREVCRRKHQC